VFSHEQENSKHNNNNDYSRSYDGVTIIEAPTEKDAMKALLLFQDVVATETLIAVPRQEAIKLL